MSAPGNISVDEMTLIDDDFWDDIETDRAVLSASVSQVQQPALQCLSDTHQRPIHVESKDGTIFQATGLCTADLDSCFNDDFEDCLNQNENAGNQRAHNEKGEAPDLFTDSSSSQLFDYENLEEVPRKRKFPGPAGILPKTPSSHSFAAVGKVADESKGSKTPNPEEELLCTPWNSEEDEPDSPWQLLRQELKLDTGKANSLSDYCVAWVLTMKRQRRLPRGKVPVLCVCIKKVSKEMLTLRDGTGEILASMDRSFQDFKTYMKAGTSLILRKVSVYMDGQKQHCLVLTRDNLVSLYSRPDDSTHTSKLEVNPMTLAELEALCSQLQREAFEDTTCNPFPVARCGLFTSGSPRNPGTPCQSGTPKTLETLGSSGRGILPTSKRTLPRRLESTRPHRPSLRQPLETKTTGWVSNGENNASGNSGYRPSEPRVSPLPTYNPPLVVSRLNTAVGTQVPSALLVPGAGSGCTEEGRRPYQLAASIGTCSRASLDTSLLPKQPSPCKRNLADFEELQWLEDEADDIFKTIDDVCLF